MRAPLAWIIGALALFAGACSTGNVAVTGAPGAAPGGAPGSAPSRDLSDGGGGSAGNPSSSSSKVFFERIEEDGGLPQSIFSVSFLPEGAEGAAPFGAPMLRPQTFRSNPIYAGGSNEVVFVRSNGFGSDTLVATWLDSWKAEPLFAFPSPGAFADPVTAFALTRDGKWLAWCRADGSLSIADLSSGVTPSIQSVDLGGHRAQSVAWSPVGAKGVRLLVRLEEDAWILAPAGQGWAKGQELKRVSAAVFNPAGDRVAAVGRDDRVLRVARLGLAPGPSEDASAEDWVKLDSSDVHDLAWGPAGMIYWARLPGGAQELRMIARDKDGQPVVEKGLARLSVPSSIQGGVVCPAWSADGSTVFFSDLVDGEYVIEKLGVRDALRGGHPALFAQPPAPDEGYICPMGEGGRP